MSGGRGAAKPPVSYEGAYDATRTYLPREIVTYTGVAYLAIAKVTGVLPTDTASWIALGGGGGGGDSDHDGTGADSTAVGTGALASGSRSTSVGDGANAFGARSAAFGYGTDAAVDSVAIGYDATNTTGNSVAVGANADAWDHGTAVGQGAAAHNHGTALGASATASGGNSTAIGYTATASGTYGIGIGDQAVGAGNNSVAIGRNAHTLLDSFDGGGLSGGGVAIGDFTSAGAGGIAIGGGATANHDFSMAFGNVTAPAVKQAAMKTDLLRLVPISLETPSGLALRSVDGEGGFTDWAIYVDISGAISTVAL